MDQPDVFAALVAMFLIFVALLSPPAAEDWKPAAGPLMTRWAKDVSPDNALPEYPRPQMVRKDWLNLNGLWQLDVAEADDAGARGPGLARADPRAVPGRVGPVGRDEAGRPRSGIAARSRCPTSWNGQRVLLHFGAVDWEATVSVNGKELGTHRGGYDAFTFDITDALKPDGAAGD